MTLSPSPGAPSLPPGAPTFVPDAQQQRAIDHPLAPLRIVAGAGSGKTEVMAQRVVSLVQRGAVGDHEVLGLTFSNKAAANLRDRIVRRLGPGNRVQVATYHGFGAQIIREHTIALGLPSEPRLLDRARSFQLLLDEFHRVDLPNRKLGRPQQLVEETLTLSSSLADHLVTVEALRADCLAMAGNRSLTPWVRRVARSRADLCILLDAYAAAKRRLGVLDFGDQIALAVEAVRSDPSIADALRHRYRAVLLDEFQDTNVAQRELLKIVWVDGFPDGAAPLTAVGDDLQSIYGFRGAHVDNLIHFDRHVPGTTTVGLETNYRSTDRIVALANHIQANIAVALPKTLRPHVAHGAVAAVPIESFVAADDRAEAQAIASRIAKVGAPWSEIAILCRKRRLIGPIAEALDDAGIPVEIIGLGGLLLRPEIVDTVAWLRLLALPEGSPEANVALLRIAQGPSYRIGLRDLATLARADRAARVERASSGSSAASESPADTIPSDDSSERVVPPADPGLDLRRALDGRDVPGLSAQAWNRLAGFRSSLSSLRRVMDRRTMVDTIEAVIVEAGLWGVVDAVGHENLLRFLHLAHSFEPLDGPRTVESFLGYLGLVELSEDDPAESTAIANDAVQLMTIHQAKGLEFDTVFVPGLAGSGSSRIFPDRRATGNGATVAAALPHWLRLDNDGFTAPPNSRAEEARLKAHVDQQQTYEELRLLYVAVTRARRRLIVSAAHWYSGPQKPQGISEFYTLLLSRPDLVTEAERAPAATENPEMQAKRRRQQAALDARLAPSIPTTPPSARSKARRTPETPALFDLRVSVEQRSEPAPLALATTSVVTFAQCPRRYEWSFVKRLPRRPNPAAAFGTAIHRWIETKASGQLILGLDDDERPEQVAQVDQESEFGSDIGSDIGSNRGSDIGDAAIDRSPAEANALGFVALEATRWDRCQTAFLSSPYAAVMPQRVEAPFTLLVTGHSGRTDVVRGRIDAVYERDSVIEVVDFKTGRFPHDGDASASVQLDIYALVAVRQWGVIPERLRTSFVYLAPNGSADLVVVSTDWSAEAVERAGDQLADRLSRISAGQFSPHGGPWCSGCDFASFCSGAHGTSASRHHG